MKFERKDIGLYVALGICGAGVGLLVGAFIAARRPSKIEEIPEDEEDWDPGVTWDTEPADPKIRVGKPEALQPSETTEFLEWAAQWNPSQIQIGMFNNGLTTYAEMEKVITQLDKVKLISEPYSYNRVFTVSGESKPDLDDLIPEVETDETDYIVLIDDRFEVITDVVEDADSPTPTKMGFSYDSDDESWAYLSGRGNHVETTQIEQWISLAAWEEVKIHLLRGTNTIFVMDHDKDELYRFDIMQTDAEDGFVSDLMDDDRDG